MISYAYNHTAKLFANNEVSLADLKVMLLDGGATFDATDTSIDDLAGSDVPPRANEVSGGGWTAGGEAVASAAVTTVTTDDAMLDGVDIDVMATGDDIGPADFAVLYDRDSGNVLAFYDFEGSKTAPEGAPFRIIWHANGLVRWTYTAP
jgi:hypothetical protein